MIVCAFPSFTAAGVTKLNPCNPLSPSTAPTSDREALAAEVPNNVDPSKISTEMLAFNAFLFDAHPEIDEHPTVSTQPVKALAPVEHVNACGEFPTNCVDPLYRTCML